MPTAIDNGSAHLNLGVTIEPLLAQHGDKRGEEGSSKTRVKDGLDADYNGLGATPRSEGGIGVGWNISKRDAGDNPEVVAYLLVIWLEVLLNVENESRCNCGEQTGLYPPMRTNEHRDRRVCEKNTHEDQGGVQVFTVFLHKVAVVLVGFTLELTCRSIRHECCWKFRGGSEREMAMT